MDRLRVLVTGASGVFGRHVARTLRGAGHRVLGLGRGAGNEIRPPTGHKSMYRTDDLRITRRELGWEPAFPTVWWWDSEKAAKIGSRR